MRFLKPSTPDAMKFLAIAICLMVVIDFFVFDRFSYHDKIREEYYAEQAAKKAEADAQKYDPVAEDYYTKNPPKMVYPQNGALYFEAENLENQPHNNDRERAVTGISEILPEPIIEEGAPRTDPVDKPVDRVLKGAGGKIAIVIDDVGMNRTYSQAALDLPSEVTLAFLPYAKNVRDDAAKAKQEGHEIVIHMPMEAMDVEMDLGDMALRTGMSNKDFEVEFDKMTAQLDGYVGVNNHMGSRLTQDENAMKKLMGLLKTRQLYFLDSRTIHTSVAAKIAEEMNVPFAVRDVFLDHEPTPEYIHKALQKAEMVAAEHGYAIAIGHPKKETMEALNEWIPTLKARGFELVPLSAVVADNSKKEKPVVKQANKIETPMVKAAEEPVIDAMPEVPAFSIY